MERLAILFWGDCMALAFVMVNTVPDKSELVLERIGEIEGVEEAYRVYGVYDVIAVVKAETTEELKGIILHIRTVKHVLSTLTLMAVK
jgi:DNA-binding Lrp family transcriptional regulator